MPPSPRLRRAAQALKDPWGLLAVAVGAGAAWAVGLPVIAVGAVGLGMVGVAAAVGAAVGRDQSSEPQRELRTGTVQYKQVSRLESYQKDLQELHREQLVPAVRPPADDAVAAAAAARETAMRVAGAVDALDGALSRAGRVASTMTSVDRVAGPVERMVARRQALLAKLTSAVDGVGEVYTKLLELSANSATDSVDPLTDPVAEVNGSLDVVRGVLAELEDDARSAREAI